MAAFDLLGIGDLILQGISLLVLQPLEYPSLFWPVVLIIALQYRRLARMKAQMFGIKREKIWRPVLIAVIYGILGGFVGSALMITFGITITAEGFAYLWPLALLLMLINIRYMCFAYAGGLLCLGAIIFDWPGISVAQIMGLVAILHMIEAFLIFVSGHQGNMPVYVGNRRGFTVGGYNLQSFWPIPLLVLTLVVPESSAQVSGMSMPSWWPLIAPPEVFRHFSPDDLLYLPLPIVAGLGYGDLAVTGTPREHSRFSAAWLAVYSFVLLGLAVLASFVPALAVLAALFGPLGHEALILWTQKRELEGTPLFVHSPRGVRVLAVRRGSPAEKLGLKPGDVIGFVNGMATHSNRELAFATNWSSPVITVAYLPGGRDGLWHQVQGPKQGNESFGVIPAPDPEDQPLVEVRTVGLIGRWLGWDRKQH
ncbi:MAG: PDZ domain-containing protein [Heliobacteriaceae bacterium]|nr:PDZ domain-containing protein [Heliobacteriaceae bacterium]